MDVKEKKTKKIMKNKKRIHCTYTCFPVNGKREQCIEREVCMYIVYIYMFCVCFSRKALRRRPVSCNSKWSPTFFSLPLTPFYFYLFFVSSFSRSRTPPSSPGYRSRGFFFLVNIDRQRRHGFRLLAYTHQATSTLSEAQRSWRERSALPHETTPGGPFEWPLRDGLSS